jgi:hypothetical protein
VLIWILAASGCAGAVEMMEASEEEAVETLPEAPSSGEPIIEETMMPPPQMTDLASGEEAASEDEPLDEPPVDFPGEVSTIPEQRLLTLERPSRIRVGDSDVVRIVLEVDEAGKITPTAFFEDHEIEVQSVEILNLYGTHIVRAEARLEMAGIEVSPSASIDRRLNPGETVEFSWSIVPEDTGTYRGNAWVFLRYIPKQEGDLIEKTLFSQPLEIQAVNLLGLGGRSARWLGAAGTVLTSLFGLDDIFKWIRRFRKGKTSVA